MTELKILYINENESDDIAYFYDCNDKILLPIETEIQKEELAGHSYVIKTLCNLLKSSSTSLEIYKFQDNRFYSYINIRTNKKTIKINCDPKLLTNLAQTNNWPVYTNKNLLLKHGIKVDEELCNELII